MDIEARVAIVALAMALVISWYAILMRPAHGVECSHKPGSGRWGYRVIDDRKCWFALEGKERRGMHRELETLWWKPPTMVPIAPDIIIMPPWEMEGRWSGAPSGWDHKE